MRLLRLLDLCCGAGGIARGFQVAGFYVVGVDIEPQPHYAGDAFVQADALTFSLDGFDAVHCSPPCQGYSVATGFHPQARDRHEKLIEIFREKLQRSGKPYVIENVAGAPLVKSIMLCGAMFGLRVYRHRYFESNVLLFQPAHPRHTVKAAGPGAIARPDQFWSVGGHFGHKDEAQAALGITWMQTQKEIANAIPPAYGKWIGQQLHDALEAAA